MDVRAALVSISGRQLHGLRLDRSQFSHPDRHCLCPWLWLQYQNDRDHRPGRRELQIQFGQGTLLSSLPQLESTRPRAQLGVFLLERDGIFGETVARRSFCFHESRYVAEFAIGTKRTSAITLHMSAFNPKRTSAAACDPQQLYFAPVMNLKSTRAPAVSSAAPQSRASSAGQAPRVAWSAR